jgi:hypothetical protein
MGLSKSSPNPPRLESQSEWGLNLKLFKNLKPSQLSVHEALSTLFTRFSNLSGR